jgi:hypothetical protein
MAISDNKKCQTLINIIAYSVTDLQRTANKLKACRQAFQTQSVDPTGTPLDGNVSAISTWIDAVDAVATSAVASGFLSHIVAGHENKALGDIE